VLVARTATETLSYLRDMPAAELKAVGLAARRRVLDSHTAARRAAELELHVMSAASGGYKRKTVKTFASGSTAARTARINLSDPAALRAS
jgi:hypothetical protein